MCATSMNPSEALNTMSRASWLPAASSPGDPAPPTAPVYTSGPTCPSYGTSLWYCHAYEYQSFPWTDVTRGLMVSMSQERPYLDPTDPAAHTLAQLWGVDSTYGPAHSSYEEIGWNVDRGLYGNDLTHLFVSW